MNDTYNEMLDILLGRTAATSGRHRAVYMNEIRRVLHGYNPFWAAHVLMRMYENNILSLELPKMNFSGNDYDTSKYVIADGDGRVVGHLVLNSSGTPVYGSATTDPVGLFGMKYKLDVSAIDSQWMLRLDSGTSEVGISVTPYSGRINNSRYYSVQWPDNTGLAGDIRLDEPDLSTVYVYVNTKYPANDVVASAADNNTVVEGLIDAKLLEEFSLTTNNDEKIGILGLAVYRLWKAET